MESQHPQNFKVLCVYHLVLSQLSKRHKYILVKQSTYRLFSGGGGEGKQQPDGMNCRLDTTAKLYFYDKNKQKSQTTTTLTFHIQFLKLFFNMETDTVLDFLKQEFMLFC